MCLFPHPSMIFLVLFYIAPQRSIVLLRLAREFDFWSCNDILQSIYETLFAKNTIGRIIGKTTTGFDPCCFCLAIGFGSPLHLCCEPRFKANIYPDEMTERCSWLLSNSNRIIICFLSFRRNFGFDYGALRPLSPESIDNHPVIGRRPINLCPDPAGIWSE